jgi:hypothetical protein
MTWGIGRERAGPPRPGIDIIVILLALPLAALGSSSRGPGRVEDRCAAGLERIQGALDGGLENVDLLVNACVQGACRQPREDPQAPINVFGKVLENLCSRVGLLLSLACGYLFDAFHAGFLATVWPRER